MAVPDLDLATGSVRFDGPQAFLEEYERNLRSGGLQVRAAGPLKLHDRLRLRIELPSDASPVEAAADVVYLAGEVAGLQLSLDDAGARRLAEEAIALLDGDAGPPPPGKVTRSLARPRTGFVLLDGGAREPAEGRVTRAFGLRDLREALSEAPGAGPDGEDSFVRVFRHLQTASATGVLACESDRGEKRVYLFAGSPANVSSEPPRESEQLGHLLVQLGRLDHRTLSDALAEAAQSGHRVGTVLVARGYLRADQLEKLLRLQVEVRLQDLFSWPEASWRFQPGRDRALEGEAHPVRLASFLARLAQRLLHETGISDLQDALGDDLHRYAHAPRGLAPIGRLVTDDRQYLALARLLDPPRTARDLLSACPLGKPATLRLLVLLREAALVTFHDRAPAHGATPPPPPAPRAPARTATGEFRVLRPRTGPLAPPRRTQRLPGAPARATGTTPAPASAGGPARPAKRTTGAFASQAAAGRAEVLRAHDLFSRLGLHYTCHPSEIEPAYARAAAEARRLGHGEEVLRLLREARDALVHDERRVGYRLRLVGQDKLDYAAEMLYRQAQMAAMKGEAREALRLIDVTLEIAPNSAGALQMQSLLQRKK